MTYTMKVAGLERQLPLCKVADNFYIGAFIIFGDAELTVACASELLKKIPADSYDYMLTAEAKSIPLIHEMARQSGAKKYFIARKGSKVYMPDPIHVSVRSITTLRTHGGAGEDRRRHRHRPGRHPGRGRRPGPEGHHVPRPPAGVQQRRHSEGVIHTILQKHGAEGILPRRVFCALKPRYGLTSP